MANPWSKVWYFRQSSSASHEFSKLCQAFECDFQELSSSYESALNDLAADNHIGRGANCTSADATTNSLVSDSAKSERMVIEYCLAKLVEFHKAGIKGPRAARAVVEEAAKVKWDEDPFLDTIPSVEGVEEIFRISRAKKFYLFVMYCCGLLGSGIAYLVDICSQWSILRWVLFLLIALLLFWAFIHLVLVICKWAIIDILDLIGSSIKDLILQFSQALVGVPMIMDCYRRWQASTPTKDVDFLLTPIDKGISEAAESTILMSQLATNLSIIPQLLQLSRMKLLGASNIISGSQLAHKDKLAVEYASLVENMEELTDVTRYYNHGVDTLITQFQSLLSEGLSRVQAVNTPVVFQDSMHFHLLIGCTFLWIRDPGLRYSHWKLNSLCVSEVVVSAATTLCLEGLDHRDWLKPGTYCSVWLTYLPGMESYMDEVVEKRIKAVKKLREFLVVLDFNMQRLLIGAERGKDLCAMIEENFGRIAGLQHRSDNAAREELTLIDKTRWRFDAWLDYFGSQSRDKKQVRLSFAILDLSKTKELHAVSFQLFYNAKNVLKAWKNNIEGAHAALQMFEEHADEGWRGAWVHWQDWDDLKGSFEALTPIVQMLAEANSQLRSKSKMAAERSARVAKECYKESMVLARSGKTPVPLEECYYSKIEVG